MSKTERNNQGEQPDQVRVESIEVIPRGVSKGAELPAPVWIGVGAIESDAHQANVVIQASQKKADVAIEISLLGGRGHESGKSAKLVIGGTTVRGDGGPVTAKTNKDGRIEGILTSSDALETCTIHTATKDVPVLFNWDMVEEDKDWVIKPDYLPVPGKLKNHLILGHHRNNTKKASWKPFDQHDVLFCVEKVEYEDEKGERKEDLNTALQPKDLKEWAYFKEELIKTDSKGRASGILLIQDRSNLLSVTVAAYDCSVWEAPASPAVSVKTVKTEGASAVVTPGAAPVDERLKHPSISPAGSGSEGKEPDKPAVKAKVEDVVAESPKPQPKEITQPQPVTQPEPRNQPQPINTEYAERLAEFDVLKKQLADKVNEANASQAQLHELQQQVERLTEMAQKAEQQQSELEQQNAEYKTRAESMGKEMSEKDLALSAAEKQRDEVNTERNILDAKVAGMTAQLEARQAHIKKMQEQLESFQNEQKEHETSVVRLKEFESDLVNLEGTTSEQEEITIQMKERLAETNGKLGLLQLKIKDNVELMANFAGTVQMEEEIAETTAQLAEKQAQIKKMQKQLELFKSEKKEHETNAARLKKFEGDLVQLEGVTREQEEVSMQMKARLVENSNKFKLLQLKINDNIGLLARFADANERAGHDPGEGQLKEYESDLVRIEGTTREQEVLSLLMKKRLEENNSKLGLLQMKIKDNVELLSNIADAGQLEPVQAKLLPDQGSDKRDPGRKPRRRAGRKKDGKQ